MKAQLAGVVALTVFLGACATSRPPAPTSPTAPPPGKSEAPELRGLASWYGVPHHGRQTANGEIYDMHAMTAAHKTLPFGTWLLVENLENGKTARVRVNDRGPFAGNRILDVSRAAAVALGALGTGVFRIRARVVPAPTAAP